MSTFDKAAKEITDLVKSVISAHHPGLKKAKVTLDVVMAAAPRDQEDSSKGPAVTASGTQVYAKVSITSRKNRSKGLADAELVIDEDRFMRLTLDRQAAVIDHQVTRLALVFDKEGELKRDDMSRPRLKLRAYDQVFAWFNDVAERHGGASIEQIEANLLASSEHGQLYFRFMQQGAAAA